MEGSSTILAGGRYNGLVRQFGGPNLSGIGYAGGYERLLLALAKETREKEITATLDAYVIALGEEAKGMSVRVLKELRTHGQRVDADYSGHGLKAQLKAAGRRAATFAILIGDEEVRQGEVTIRDLKRGEQRRVSVDEVAGEVRVALS